jgi:16S rRNA (guanine527-N7)-methyltransferase
MKDILSAEKIILQCAALGRNLLSEEARLLAAYLNLLVKWNRHMNLVGPKSGAEILETLVQDSWVLADLLAELSPQPAETLDLGAGAGLPGIPLRIFWKSGRYFLVEPRLKRAIFMEQALAVLGLEDTAVLRMRMEELPFARRQAGLIVSRAFRPWQELLADVREYLAPDGRVVVMTNAPGAEDAPGYALEKTREYVVAGKKRYLRLFICGGSGKTRHE